MKWVLVSVFALLTVSLFSCSGLGVKEAHTGSGEDEEIAPKGCASSLGFVVEGSSIMAYQEPQPAPGQNCQAETRTCLNGVLSGSFLHVMCNEPQVLPTIEVTTDPVTSPAPTPSPVTTPTNPPAVIPSQPAIPPPVIEAPAKAPAEGLPDKVLSTPVQNE